MAISESDQQVLDALSAAREEHQELADLLSFYCELYRVQFQAKSILPPPQIRDELAAQWRLEGGIPQLTFDQMSLEPASFAQLVSSITDVLLRHNPGWQADPSALTPQQLVELAREVFETWDTLTTPRAGAEKASDEERWPDHPTSLAVGFSLAPYLQRASEVILPRLDLATWGRSYCPICGGRPNFALLDEEQGARQLMCSRCASLWPYRRVGCPFCTTEEPSVYYASDDGLHRLYVCQACKEYLKVADLRVARRPVYPMVERLLTIGMDLAARQEGYGG